jgi:hypothetical protein
MSDMSEVDVSNYATKKRGETMVSERLSEASSIETVTMQKELQHQWKLQELPIKEEQSMSSHNKSDYPLTQHLLKASDKSEESYMEAWKSLSPEQQQEFHREQEDIKRRQYQG